MNQDQVIRVLKLVDHNYQFEFNEHQSGIKPTILNRIDLSLPDYIEILRSKISSDGGGSEFIPKCPCGELEGVAYKGIKCPVCNQEAQVNNLLDEDHLVCKNWLACPTDLKNGWLAPKIYLNLAEWLSYTQDKKKRNYLDDILDVTTPIPYELKDVINGKGFAYFYNNFDRIIDYFAHIHPTISKKPDTIAIKYCISMNREKVFCRYIPILNSALSPIANEGATSPNKKIYTDTTANNILRAAISLSALEFDTRKKKNWDYHVERITFGAFKDIIAYVEESTKKYISLKKAIPRTHLFGGRCHLSFRCVIAPITKPHMPDELHVPWKLAVNTFRVHIYGYLFREHKLTIDQAVDKLHRALQIYDKDIHEILIRMIRESPEGGIPCFWDRPPSIRDGSIMVKYITEVKTDIDDSTISISVIDHKLPNLDFDGDHLAGVVILENEMVRKFRNISPNHLIFDRNTGDVTSDISLNKTLFQTWNRFLQNV